MRHLAIILFFLTLPAFSAEVIKFTEAEGEGQPSFLAIAKDKGHKVEINQSLCFFRQKQKLGCGLVIRLSDKGYIVSFDNLSEKVEFKPGDKMEVRKMKRSTASQSNKLDIIQTAYETEYIYKSIVGGFNLMSPYARYEQMLLPWLNLGVMPMAVMNQGLGSVTLSGAGAFATTSVYPLEPLNQLWGMGGVGGLFGTAKAGAVEEKVLCAAAFMTAGWRFRFGGSGSFGAAVGAQFYLFSGSSAFATQASLLQPTFMVDAGFIF